MSPIKLTLIAAVAKNGVIGANNAIPWHLPADLKHFKATTMGHTVVMGRKTYESLPQALPERKMVVISQTLAGDETRHQGVVFYPSWERAWEALSKASVAGLMTDEKYKKDGAPLPIFIIGGGALYRQTLPLAERLILTEIHCAFDGDVFFPEYPPSPKDWQEHRRIAHLEPFPFDFVEYHRRKD